MRSKRTSIHTIIWDAIQPDFALSFFRSKKSIKLFFIFFNFFCWSCRIKSYKSKSVVWSNDFNRLSILKSSSLLKRVISQKLIFTAQEHLFIPLSENLNLNFANRLFVFSNYFAHQVTAHTFSRLRDNFKILSIVCRAISSSYMRRALPLARFYQYSKQIKILNFFLYIC